MDKQDIIFEILHYLAYDSTVMSVEYIKKNIDTDDYRIVIVDNLSPDGSGARLKDKYKSDDKVTVISNSSNEGFTRGNNYGIKFIKEHYKYEFMVVMNNDVMLIETALVYKLRQYMLRDDFAVAGPNVVDRFGSVSNPVAYELPSDKLISERIAGPEKLVKYDRYGLMRVYDTLASTSFRIQRFFRGESKKKYIFDECKDVVLHGCFWIFSRRFFEKYPMLADKKYMYGEEETLQLCIEMGELTSIYMPDVTVLHLHQSSSKEAFKNSTERSRFIALNQKETWKEYLELRDKLKRSHY